MKLNYEYLFLISAYLNNFLSRFGNTFIIINVKDSSEYSLYLSVRRVERIKSPGATKTCAAVVPIDS